MLKYEMTLSNDLSELERLHRELKRICGEWGLGEDMLFHLNLVIEEVVSNIILYGFEDKQTSQEILLEMLNEGSRLDIKITDNATPFNPLGMPSPDDLDKPAHERKVGGLGVHLIRTLMDEVTYEYSNGCNILRMIKKIA